MPQTDGKIPLVGELPRYTGSENVFEDETVAVYATADPVPQVAEITLKLLEKDGWRGKVTAQDASMRHLTFRRGRLKLTAYISVAKGLGNRTAIQYHLVQL